jgi:hypothetical protein
MADYEDDVLPPGANAISNITALAQLQIKHEATVADLEAKLKKAKKTLASVAEKELPEAMAAIGMKKFSLTDGTEIAVKDGLNASLTGKYKVPASKWLKKVGSDRIIDVTVSIPVTSVVEGDKLVKKLDADDVKAFTHEGINTASFKAVVMERRRDGEEIPDDIGVNFWTKSSVTLPESS